MSIRFKMNVIVTIVLILIAACGQAEPMATPIPPTATLAMPTPPPTLPPTATILPSSENSVTRDLLSHNDLVQGFPFTGPVDESAFAMPDDAAPPAHVFEGRLELLGEKNHGKIDILKGSFPPEFAYLPTFDFAFVQHETYLIPVSRTVIIGADSGWNILLEPGRVWQEAGDRGNSRASFPFTLMPKGTNATFNGTMTFLFDGEGVSKVWYQVTQETTIYSRANLWGLLDAVYHREAVSDAGQIRTDFVQELASRFPTKPIEALAVDYPGIDLAAFGRLIGPENTAWYGFVINGVNYVDGCQTRFGRYTYCEALRAASYSTSKSAFVAVALMRLAQKYGPEVADLLIKDYVPESAKSIGDWEHVTFGHTLDMATGNYYSAGYMVDDESEQMTRYAQVQSYAWKIAAAFNWPHREEPGQRWVYRSSDTFILVSAMQNFLRTKEGPDADIYQFVVDEVYKPLDVGPSAYSTLRTEDNNWQGVPDGGQGLWCVADDIAKITTLLNADQGKINGVQILHPDLLAAAIQRNPEDRGFEIDQDRYYNNGFWATRYTEEDSFDCEFWTAEMVGISGNVVALMPNGTTYYYFSDSHEFFWTSAVRESDKLMPFCSSVPVAQTAISPTASSASDRVVISVDAANQVERLQTLRGHTGRVIALAFSGDGTYIASSSLDKTIKLWAVEDWQDIHTFTLNKAGLDGIAFSPDGRLLASADAIWDVKSGEVVHILEHNRNVPGPIAFSPDGSLLAIALEGRPIKLWNVANGEVSRTFAGPLDDVTFSITFSPDGALLAAGVHGGMVRLWHAASGEIAGTLKHGGEEDDVHDLAFSPDGQMIVSAGNDETVRLWDVTSRQVVHTLRHGNGLYGVAFSPDGSLIAAACCDRTVKLWDVATGRLLRSLPHGNEVMAVTFSPDGTLLASGGYDNLVYVWGLSH